MLFFMTETAVTGKNATLFEFVSHEYAEGSPTIAFAYKVHFSDAETLVFAETITLQDADWAGKLPASFREAILQDLHVALGVSYYKLFCPPAFKTDMLFTPTQAAFWNTLYRKGLGEFLYRNNLDPQIVAQFTSHEDVTRIPTILDTDARSLLIGIGGGKDSIVSLELLKEYSRTGFVVATGKENSIAEEVAGIAGVELSKIKRTLDPKLVAGVEGSYNGHVPISAVYAFLGVLEAALEGQGYVIVSNEYSSNFGNLMHEGNEVNHQWSKSAEFEALFQSYVRMHLTQSISYFSLLRPFYELRIVKMFTEVGKKYFQTFSSCNRNFTHTHDGTSRWCGECPKCAFAFLMLSAFLPKDEVIAIFKKDLFEDRVLLSLFTDILGYGTMKPFDCVGTFDESRVAFSMAKENWGSSYIVSELLPLCASTALSTEVFKAQKALTVPSAFRLVGIESALILGYGKEGKTSEMYLKQRFPHLRIGIADKADGEGYLEKQHEYDIIVRTPVIPSSLVVRQSVTATQLFFREAGRENILGVTGSKGKSTTSTLLYLMLKESGRKVRLVGNIGVPALESILGQEREDGELFVFELSSYQLEDLDVSPHIALLTSLFPEHLDHHGSLEAYFEAKRSIIAFQTATDWFACSPELALPQTWVQTVFAQRLQTHLLPFEIQNTSLRGAHNLQNAILAYTVASELGVSAGDAEQVIASYQGLPHRLQHIGTFKGIEFYDDSISTTPESTIAGIRALQNVDTIILGGVDRGYNFIELEKELREKNVKNIVLFPQSGEHMLSSEEGLAILHTSSMEEAVQFAYAHTAKGMACLLSPSAPSYNLFTNFEERGNIFKEEVIKYGNGEN